MTRIFRLSSILFFLFFIIHFSCLGQSAPKREFRGVWVATVLNIDWPSRTGLNAKQQKKEIDNLLDYYCKLNLNVVILQIRPVADAFYMSNIEPWSQYLSGTQGNAPNPLYDPLDYFIEGCHKRGMELHAWLNPFRVKQKNTDELASGHVFRKHPEWGWEYGSKTYLDPGIPEVRDFVAGVVRDVVKRYDIDAIHFDDYFYPYPLKGLVIPDEATFLKYSKNSSSENICDWRRANIDTFIYTINKEIHDIKPWVQFGISPFGVWRNKINHPDGSDTQAGVQAYDVLYADIIKWLKMGWVDYLVPQIYWHFGHTTAGFEALTDWWNEHTYGRNVYVGHGLYRLTQTDSDPAWRNPIELPRQITKVRNSSKLKGSAWFSSKHFFNEKLGFTDLLRNSYYNHKAIVPTAIWIDAEKPMAPIELKAERVRDHNIKLVWDRPFVKNEMDKARFFVIYRFEEGQSFDSNDPKYIFDIVQDNEYLIRIPLINLKREKYVYRVSSLDRLNNESELGNPVFVNE